jgi:2-iminobutanoate/2-iminopropanoate deaminase
METTKQKQIFHLKSFEKSYGYAQAVKVGNLIYVSGTVSIDNEGNPTGEDDMPFQVRSIYEDIRSTLKAFDITFDNVIKEAIFSTDLERFKNEGLAIRASYYQGCSLPASSAWIEVKSLAFPQY